MYAIFFVNKNDEIITIETNDCEGWVSFEEIEDFDLKVLDNENLKQFGICDDEYGFFWRLDISKFEKLKFYKFEYTDEGYDTPDGWIEENYILNIEKVDYLKGEIDYV